VTWKARHILGKGILRFWKKGGTETPISKRGGSPVDVRRKREEGKGHSGKMCKKEEQGLLKVSADNGKKVSLVA